MLWIPGSSGDDSAVNPNGISKLFANDVGTFFLNGKPTFINDPKGLPKNSSDGIILDSWVLIVLH